MRNSILDSMKRLFNYENELDASLMIYCNEQPDIQANNLMFPAAAILVFLLYLLLFHELITQFCYSASDNESTPTKTVSTIGYRPKLQPTQTKKSIHSLDVLWKRMRAASENFRLNGLKHAMITKTMADARAEARRQEQLEKSLPPVKHSSDIPDD